jgi:hypothetical protein
MGNSIYRFLCGLCSPSPEYQPHGAHPAVAALGRDIQQFEATSQVPDGLSRHVVSSKKAQANWCVIQFLLLMFSSSLFRAGNGSEPMSFVVIARDWACENFESDVFKRKITLLFF